MFKPGDNYTSDPLSFLTEGERARLNELRMRIQKEAFQAAINGAPVEDALNILVRMVIKETKGEARTAFYLADEEDACLHPIFGAGNMPRSYLAKMDGFPIATDSLACGPATPSTEQVLVPDVFEEPLWKPWLHLAAEFNFAGCWSFPIKAHDNKSVGTFAMYFHDPHEATPNELIIADIVTQAAAVILSKHLDTRERAKAEEALHKSEEKYRTLFNTIDEGFCIMELIRNAHGKITGLIFREVNQAFERQTGLSDLTGKTVSEVLPNLEQYWIDIYTQVIETGKSLHMEDYIKDDNRWYNMHVSPLGGKDRSMVSVVFVDITDLKLRERQKQFLLKFSDVLRPLDDATAIQTKASRMLCKHLGVNRARYVGIETNGRYNIVERDYTVAAANFAGHYRPDDFGRKLMHEAQTGHTLAVSNVRTDPRLSDTERTAYADIGVAAHVTIPFLKEGRLTALFAVTQTSPRRWTSREISLIEETAERVRAAVEKAKAEEALRESEENYRVIVEQSISGILKVSLSRDIIFSNEQFAERLGYSVEELTHMKLDDIIAAEDLERDKTLFNRLITKGRAYEIEKRMKRKDGSLFWVNNQIAPLFNHKGVPQAAVDISADISRQKAVEQQKDEFITVASHELKTPITSIKAYGELLEQIHVESGNTDNALLMKRMNRQINRLTDLVYMLLDTTRISGGELTLHPQKLDLNDFIAEQIKNTPLTAPRHKITFHPQPLPPVFADRDRIGQVFMNLTSNAVKYSPAGGDIVITSEEEGNYAKISVRDQGIGISPEQQDKIFHRFYRITDESTKFISGIGMGLYIAMEIIKKHGGLLGVESMPGKGSTFYFKLPYLNNG